MNQITPPPKIEIIPSSAPFSEARSWLNGFFAGLLSDAPTPLSAEQGAAVMEGGPATAMTARRPGTTRPCRCRPHEASPKAAAAAAHDGGDGAAGLRPVRLRLP